MLLDESGSVILLGSYLYILFRASTVMRTRLRYNLLLSLTLPILTFLLSCYMTHQKDSPVYARVIGDPFVNRKNSRLVKIKTKEI